MDSMDATTPLVPKKLLFTAATPYATPSPSGANAAKPIHPSQRFSPAAEQPAEPRPAPVVRYGLPQDPESYYARFVRSDNVRRYGLLDISSDEDEEDDLVQGKSFGSRTGETPQIAEISPVESMMERLKLHWQTAAEQRSAERSKRLQDVFLAADQELAGQLDLISEKIHRKQVEQKQADERQNTQQLQARTHQLQELQRSHDKAAAKQQEQVERLQRAAEAEAEAAKRRQEEEEEARRKAEAKAAAEAAEAAARAAASREQEEAAKQAEQAKAAANAAQAAAAAAAAVKPKVMSAAHHCIRCAPQAKAFELEVEQRAKAIIDTLQPLIADDSCKKARRDIEKKMTVHVQQISATQDQVARKCGDVYQLIASQQSLTWRQYALYMFATKVIRQADLVMLNNKAAFPLATVLVKVSTEFPELMDLAVHLLHRECCFSVPCSFVRRDEGSGAELSAMQLRRLLGYKELEDPNNAGGKMYESDDAFISRVEGIMFLYGAIVQVQESRNPHGLDCAWRWLARFLNAIPASRAAGKALIFFLRAAGYAMYLQYRGQFIKLLKCMYDEFLPELAMADEPDIQAVHVMLKHYLVDGQYKIEPEGRSMPRIDMSSMTRA